KKIIGDEEQITCRPADTLEPELETIRESITRWEEQDEDVLTAALFLQVAPTFFQKREERSMPTDPGMFGEDVEGYPV
ncbi:MAG: oxaloacetate decarboxylase subunit alpha, partial [Eubacterium sp.]|nr:oxaloacetate decarboxylase subunit alpha [Candidatus Colimonas fimequi]